MLESPPVPPEGDGANGPPARGPDAVLRWTLSALNAVGTLIIFGLMAMINWDVWQREIVGRPIHGVSEMIELLIVAIVFLQLGDATRSGRLTRSDGLFNFVLDRRPRIGRAMGATFDLLGALFMGLIVYGTWPIFIEAYEKDLYTGNIGVFAAPTWPVKAIIVVGSVMVLAQFVAFAWRYIIPGRAGAEPPNRPA
ncbi:MAG: TRAP transporter small permease [Alphaproteobacteria bacterium]